MTKLLFNKTYFGFHILPKFEQIYCLPIFEIVALELHANLIKLYVGMGKQWDRYCTKTKLSVFFL